MPIDVKLLDPTDISVKSISTTPYYDDACDHGEDAYLFSYEHLSGRPDGTFCKEKRDVYVFEDYELEQHWCIRYGNEPSEYYSPGDVLNLSHTHKDIVEILMTCGYLRYELFTETEE